VRCTGASIGYQLGAPLAGFATERRRATKRIAAQRNGVAQKISQS